MANPDGQRVIFQSDYIRDLEVRLAKAETLLVACLDLGGGARLKEAIEKFLQDKH